MQIFFILISFGLTALTVHLYQQGTRGAVVAVPLVLALAAMAWITRKADIPPEPAAEPHPPSPSKARRAAGGALLALGLALCTLASYRLTIAWHGSLLTWGPLFLCGLVMACLGADCAQGYLQRGTGGAGGADNRRRAAIAAAVFLLILAAGAWLRAYRLNWYPPPDGATTIEEFQFGNFSYQIINRNYRHWEWMQTSYPGALAFYLFGPSLVHARIHGVIFGTLSLIPLYLLLCRLRGYKAALFATALMAVCVWHFTCSRYNDAVYHGVFFVVICLALMVHSCRSPRLSLSLWIGFLSAAELYDYDAFKPLPIAVLIFFSARWGYSTVSALRVKDEEKMKSLLSLLRRGWKKPALLLLMMTLVSAPVISHALREPNRFFNGINRATHGGIGRSYYDTDDWSKFIGKRMVRFKDIVELLYYRAPGRAQHCTMFMPGDPALDLMTRTLLVLALTYALLHPLRRHNWFFLMMFALVIVGGGIVTNNLDIRRLPGLVPYAYILIGLLAGKVFSIVDNAHPRGKPGRWIFAALMAGTLALGIANYRYAFRKVYVLFGSTRFRNQYTLLTKLVNRLGKEDRPILITEYPLNFFRDNDYFWMIDMRKGGITSPDILTVPELLGNTQPPDDAVLIFQKPYDLEFLADWMRSLCPSLDFRSFGDAVDPEWARGIFCRITPEQREEIAGAREHMGLSAEYASLGEGPEIRIERIEPIISIATIPGVFKELAFHGSPNFGYKAKWTGYLNIPEGGSYEFSLKAQRGGGQLFIDNKEVGQGSRINLQRGSHPIMIEAEFKKDRAAGIRLLWKMPGVKSWEPVPLWKIASPGK